MTQFRLRNLLGFAAFFLVCCVSQTIHEQRFRESQLLTAPITSLTVADPENFTFSAVGDLHIIGGGTALLRRMLEASTTAGNAFFVALGDIVDQGLRDDFVAFRSALSDLGWNTKSFSILGNHDVYQGGWDPFKELNGPATYTFTVGNSLFIALDTADASLGESQLAWLREQLDKPRPKHTFLLSHYLPVIPGYRTTLKFANDIEALKLMKLASEKKVTAWIGAHYHSYIKGEIEGVTYVAAGGGGGRRMDPVLNNFILQVTVAGDSVSFQDQRVD